MSLYSLCGATNLLLAGQLGLLIRAGDGELCAKSESHLYIIESYKKLARLLLLLLS